MSMRPITPGAVESDIAKIINNKVMDPDTISYKVILHTIDDDIDITELISIEVDRDYANNISDYILVTFTMGMGEYLRKVHPRIDNLEMTIVTKYYNDSYLNRYKLLIVNGPTNIAGTMYSSYSEEELNKMDKFIIEGQCINRLVEVLRRQPVDGIYNYITVRDAIRTVITNAVNKTTIEGVSPETKFNFVDPNNDKTFRHISIPLGINALDLPSYLQNTDYGVYSSDIGTYIQKHGYFIDGEDPVDTIFVYPLYNPKLVDKPGKKLMILSSPNNMLSTIENSYLEEGDILKIIGSGNMRSSEISQTKLINTGNAIIRTNIDNMLKTGGDVTDNTVSVSRANTMSGETLVAKRDGYDGVNYVKPSTNIYKQYSEMAKNVLSLYQVTWNFSNPELLFPGMPVIYVYEDTEHGVIRLNGIIHSCFIKYNAVYKTHSTLINVMLESYIDGVEKKTDEVDVSY